MAISAVLMRRLNEFLSSKFGNSLLPRGTSTPFSDFISTATLSEKRNVSLLICVWTMHSGVALDGEFWLAMIGATGQGRTQKPKDIERGKAMGEGETRPLTNSNMTLLVVTNGSSDF